MFSHVVEQVKGLDKDTPKHLSDNEYVDNPFWNSTIHNAELVEKACEASKQEKAEVIKEVSRTISFSPSSMVKIIKQRTLQVSLLYILNYY